MRLALRYFQTYFLSTVRNVPAFFFTLIFPPLLMVLFAHEWGEGSGVGGVAVHSLGLIAVFFNYSVQTVALMLVGMGVTEQRNSQWAKYLRTLPVGIFPMIGGRLLHALALSFINLVVLSLMTIFVLGVRMPADELLYVVAIALAGGIPMAIFGLTIGYAANPESSRSIFTLLNVLLLFGAFSLPATGISGTIRNFIPSYQWNQLSSWYLDRSIHLTTPLFWLGGYSLLALYILSKIMRKKQKQ